MTTELNNKIFKAISNAIYERYEYRCVVSFDNGDTLLVDFSDCGYDFETDAVCIYSLQRPTYDADGQYNGTDELDYGAFTQYSEAYDFVRRTMDENPGRIYVESF